MRHTEIIDYLDGPFQDILGWCAPEIWMVIQPLAEAMARVEPARPVAEIGVHHGKLLIGLVKTMGAPEGNLAIDLFGQQELNLDRSGKGNLAKFRANLALCGVPESAVDIVESDSLNLDRSWIDERRRMTGGGFSFFSVDGSHQVEHTLLDLQTAEDLTAHRGVIMIDDYNNMMWPGVHEAVAKRYLTFQPKFAPLAFCGSKLFLCHLSFHETYLDVLGRHLDAHFPENMRKLVKMFGYSSLTIARAAHQTRFVMAPE